MNNSERLDAIIDAVQGGLFQRRSHIPSRSLANAVLNFYVRNINRMPDISRQALLSVLDTAQAYPADWEARLVDGFRTVSRGLAWRPVPTLGTVRKPRVIHGRFEDHAHLLAPGSVSLLLTSPVYAMQRFEEYGGITEEEYPDYTAGWFSLARPAMAEDGTLAMVIRPHVVDGRESPYVRHTIDRVEADGWIYRGAIIWIKVDAPPLGRVNSPRRSYELVLLFSLIPNSYCNPRAYGRFSSRLGLTGKKGFGSYIHAESAMPYRSGIARHPDYIVTHMNDIMKGPYHRHPAPYPLTLVRPIVGMFSRRGGLVADPFTGSGTTLVGAMLEGRNAWGTEVRGGYVNEARRAIVDARRR